MNEYNGFRIELDACSHFYCQLINSVKMLLFFLWARFHKGKLIIEKTIS